MPQTLRFSHHYPCAPDALFALATDMGVLQDISEGLIAYRGMPRTRFEAGTKVDVEFSLLGRLPWAAYHIEVRRRDDAARRFETFEYGGPLKSWRHEMAIVPREGGAVMQDTIRIDAGLRSLSYKLWGQYMYARRHRARLALVRSLNEA